MCFEFIVHRSYEASLSWFNAGRKNLSHTVNELINIPPAPPDLNMSYTIDQMDERDVPYTEFILILRLN